MQSAYTASVRTCLAALQAKYGWQGELDDEDLAAVTALVEQAVAAERQACAEFGDEFAMLCGSWAAQQIAARIRARGEAG